nr:disintegrin and metalloproteinase domain-containing protein 2-like [Columba livia]
MISRFTHMTRRDPCAPTRPVSRFTFVKVFGVAELARFKACNPDRGSTSYGGTRRVTAPAVQLSPGQFPIVRKLHPCTGGGCYYQGYIEGVPSSTVTLSVCSGLRGLLQFENVTYGIEPLGHSPVFEHFVYQVRDENVANAAFASSHPDRDPVGLATEEVDESHGDDEPVPKFQRELALHIILERALYEHLGEDDYVVTQKIAQVSSLLNSMFRYLNLTVTLSSMGVWMDNSTFRAMAAGQEAGIAVRCCKQA